MIGDLGSFGVDSEIQNVEELKKIIYQSQLIVKN